MGALAVRSREHRQQVRQIAPPPETTEGPFWKWMAVENGRVFGLVGETEPPDPDATWKSTTHGWPWDGISKGYNAKDYTWGFSRTLLAFDAASASSRRTRRPGWRGRGH